MALAYIKTASRIYSTKLTITKMKTLKEAASLFVIHYTLLIYQQIHAKNRSNARQFTQLNQIFQTTAFQQIFLHIKNPIMYLCNKDISLSIIKVSQIWQKILATKQMIQEFKTQEIQQ
ncbi:hypothetical protein TTHERM_001125330 (macronuclear) [Tetrahymena thermophila SB210]|uniref:Uncharacterized protein n=1 Tax=Tetrahymena thermophila (strain SB210) TaxID=312017 RepID=W7X6A5_TETTS|nr:hypothetical protein TTHERM_001125330 [Tetrahymena thermophila SB210]EWS71883.1 hypothetical protein TTHERM_001125330 [Tetrahymena thermophila SB210]|eukprot:XP_012655587.1 hypothetical protein TTHERM_001125330 [Tetrahymena thermophila SB210]